MAVRIPSLEELNRIRRFKEAREGTDVDFSEAVAKKAARKAKGRQTIQPLESRTASGNSVTKAQAGASLAKTLASDQGGGSGGIASTAASSAASGFAIGGPKGAIIGGVVGGTIGILKARSARKKAAREAEAKKHEALAQIEDDKATRINAALKSMAQSIGSTLRQNRQLGSF